MKKIISLVLATLIPVLFFAGCSSNQSKDVDYPVTVEGVTLNKSPENVVVLSDSLADVILKMGYERKLVGRSDQVDQKDLLVLPSVGDALQPNIDKIKELKTDLILSEAELSDQFKQLCDQNNIPFIKINKASNRVDFSRLYTDVGCATSGAKTGYERGNAKSQDLILEIDDIIRRIPQTSIPITACYLYDENGTQAGGNDFINMLIESAGAINIAKSQSENKVDIDVLKRSNPSFIFCPVGLKTKILENPDFSNLSAVKQNKIYEIEKRFIERQGETILAAIETMAKIMYPDIKTSITEEIKAAQPENTSSQTTENNTVAANIREQEISEKKANVEKVDVSDTAKIQQKLDSLGYNRVDENGQFDLQEAIKDFQYLNDMIVTGEISENLIEFIFSNSAKPRA